MDKIKEIVKKYGNYIELGGFVLTIIGVFLPFVTVSIWGFSASASIIKATLGVFMLIFGIIGAGLIAVDTFASNVFDNLKKNNKYAGLALSLTPLLLAFLNLLFNIIKGAQASTEYSHLNIGFYLILLGALAGVCVRAVRCFVLKEVKFK